MRPRIIELLSQWGLGNLSWLIPSPGAVYSIVVIALALVYLRRAKLIGILPARALEAALAGAVGAGIGSRAFYLVTTGDLFRVSPVAWLDGGRGTASWGAYLGAIGGLWLYGTLVKMPVLPLIDVGASFASLGEGIGRWSCFLAGDDFGRITNSPLGIRFPAGSLAHQAHVARGLLPADSSLSLPVHPLQFYLMANALVVFLLCSIAWYRWRQIPGRTLATFLLLQGSTRFWWEFLRDPAGGGARGLLSTSQWMCISLVCVGLGLLYYTKRRPASPLQAATSPL